MPVFESSAEDVLGLWSATPVAASVSFGVETSTGQPSAEVYRSNLPADPQAALQVFSDSSDSLIRVKAALEDVPNRLDGLVTRTKARQAAQPAAGISFAIGDSIQEPGLEGELLSMLAEADQGAQGTLSFGIGDMAGEAWNSAKAQLDALIAQIDRDVLHFAWVETSISGQLVARTTVAWGGDLQNFYEQDIDSDQSNLHEHTLQTVTLTRHLRLRLFMTVAAGSVKVAGLMVTPGGAVLALPAIFQFVTKIVAQARDLQSIQNPQGV